MSLLVLDVGIQVVIIDSIFKAYKRNKRRDEVEEENLTRYESYDHRNQQSGWEFKIVRANGNAFRDRKVLKRVCQEESKSGWILLEKLDDRRLRFRRPVAAREQDHLCKQDPYRSYYGISPEIATVFGIIFTIAILSIPAYLGFAAVQNLFHSIPASSPSSAPTPKPNLAKPQNPPASPTPQPTKNS